MPETTIYALCVAGAALLGCLLFVWNARRHALLRGWMYLAPLAALVLGAQCARGYVVLAREIYSGYGFSFALTAYPYDYAVCGALLGVVLACAVCAHFAGVSIAQTLDCAAPCMLTTLTLCRLAEVFSDFGWGSLVQSEGLQFFPIAVADLYGMWHSAVFMLEALLAGLVLMYVLRMGVKEDGERFALMLLWWSMAQIVCESLRAETLRWGFVRIQQVNCVLFGLMLLLGYAAKRRLEKKRLAGMTCAYLGGVGLLAFVEFALDKLPAIPHPVLYVLMSAVVLVMGALVQSIIWGENRHKPRAAS